MKYVKKIQPMSQTLCRQNSPNFPITDYEVCKQLGKFLHEKYMSMSNINTKVFQLYYNNLKLLITRWFRINSMNLKIQFYLIYKLHRSMTIQLFQKLQQFSNVKIFADSRNYTKQVVHPINFSHFYIK